MGAADDDLLAWVCDRAAANRSVSRCNFCEWFQLLELAPSGEHVRLPAAECSIVQPKLAWFMCLTPATDSQALQHLDYVKAAIVSARLNAPSLAPYVVLISHEDAEMSAEATAEGTDANQRFLCWLRLVGVPLLPHRLSFYDQLPMKSRRKRTSKNPNLNVGAFGRMDIGLIVQVMRNELLSRGLDAERVLYTDTDVLFAGDVDYVHLAAMALPTFAAGTEVFSPAMNSGVMLINATTWAAHHSEMVSHGRRRNFRFLSYDQTWVHEYFTRAALRAGWSQGWTTLDDAAYNARGFMHPMRPAHNLPPVLPRLWHWHGFKPHDVDCWHRAIRSGAWPLRAWRNTVRGCTGKTRPRCTFMPVHNSGCRYFGRLTAVLAMTPCYLRTYTYLLQQHRRMLHIANRLNETSGVHCDARDARSWAAWDRGLDRVAARAPEAQRRRCSPQPHSEAESRTQGGAQRAAPGGIAIGTFQIT